MFVSLSVSFLILCFLVAATDDDISFWRNTQILKSAVISCCFGTQHGQEDEDVSEAAFSSEWDELFVRTMRGSWAGFSFVVDCHHHQPRQDRPTTPSYGKDIKWSRASKLSHSCVETPHRHLPTLRASNTIKLQSLLTESSSICHV
ncbi:uncharacterized protein [Venturia canescens]|uniref:uncharacterized protein n=1 Tax=Venturia canescens TaxID=32260 RepID=UPI001C9CA808|nr:uncharacterized protein LOC122408061 [Venturia canescens]